MPEIDQNEPHIAILMTVRNGAKFLDEQIQSIAAQDHRNWTLYASDDGSTDDSRDILNSYAKDMPNMRVFDGPRQGQSANVMALLRHASPDIENKSWVALADQDDVWLPHRLSRGVEHIRTTSGPALSCARTLIAEHDLTNPHPSRLHTKPPSFENALVQNIASGNTILLNAEGAALIRDAARHADSVYAPDWWIYQLVCGAGGEVVFDPEPALMYRQHDQNRFGENRSAAASQRRVLQVLNGEYRDWVTGNTKALASSEHLLTNANRDCLHKFSDLHGQNALARMRTFSRLGLYRQTRMGTVAIWCAALIGRI